MIVPVHKPLIPPQFSGPAAKQQESLPAPLMMIITHTPWELSVSTGEGGRASLPPLTDNLGCALAGIALVANRNGIPWGLVAAQAEGPATRRVEELARAHGGQAFLARRSGETPAVCLNLPAATGRTRRHLVQTIDPLVPADLHESLAGVLRAARVLIVDAPSRGGFSVELYRRLFEFTPNAYRALLVPRAFLLNPAHKEVAGWFNYIQLEARGPAGPVARPALRLRLDSGKDLASFSGRAAGRVWTEGAWWRINLPGGWGTRQAASTFAAGFLTARGFFGSTGKTAVLYARRAITESPPAFSETLS